MDLVAAAHLLVEVPGEHLDMPGFVDDLRRGVQLGVVQRMVVAGPLVIRPL